MPRREVSYARTASSMRERELGITETTGEKKPSFPLLAKKRRLCMRVLAVRVCIREKRNMLNSV